jgi:hypothetical protein
VFFIFGDRVFSTLQASLERDKAIGALLSTGKNFTQMRDTLLHYVLILPICSMKGPDDFVDKITVLNKQLKDLLKSTKTHMREISELVALKITSPPLFPPPISPTTSKYQPVSYHRTDADAEFLNSLAKVLSERAPDVIFFLTAGEEKSGGAVVCQGPQSDAAAVNDLWKRFVGGMGGEVKGGGKNGRFMGKASSWGKLEVALKEVEAVRVENA